MLNWSTTDPGNGHDDPDMASIDKCSGIDDVMIPSSRKDGGAQSDSRNPTHDNFLRPTVTDCEPVSSNNRVMDVTGIEAKARVNNFPLFVANSSVSVNCVDENVLLFTAPGTPEGHTVDVYTDCARGICKCLHYLGGVRSQLRPCRFAYLLFGGFVENVEIHELVYNGVCDGFKIVDQNVNPYACDNYASILDATSKAAMDTILARELDEGYISKVDHKPNCVHALGAVPKGENDIRPITDCSCPEGRAVNDHCATLVKKFTYNTVQNVVELIKPGYVMTVVDIQAAYRAVPVYPAHREYLGFNWVWQGYPQYFIDNRLCFGLSSGPYYFHSISCFVAEILSSAFGVSLVHYLDDYIIVAPTLELALSGQKFTIVTLRYLGFYVSWRKISTPSTCTTYLGIQIDTVKMELRLPNEKVEKFRRYVSKYVTAGYITKKELEQLNGLLAHCAQIVQGGKIFTRRCFDQYRLMVLQNRKRSRISPGMRQDVEWWSLFAPGFNGVNLIPYKVHDICITTDASLRGFGAVYANDWLIGSWDSSLDPVFVRTDCGHLVDPPALDPDQLGNINVLELWAVIAALERWATRFRNSILVLYIDNMQVIHMLRNGSSVNTQCMSWIRRIFWHVMQFNVSLSPQYIPTENNVAADTLSRVPYGIPFDKFVEKMSEFNLCCWSELCNTIRCRGGSAGGGCEILPSVGSGKVNQRLTDETMGLLC